MTLISFFVNKLILHCRYLCFLKIHLWKIQSLFIHIWLFSDVGTYFPIQTAMGKDSFNAFSDFVIAESKLDRSRNACLWGNSKI